MTSSSDLGRSAHLWRTTVEPNERHAKPGLRRALGAGLLVLGALPLIACSKDNTPVLKERGIRDANGNIVTHPAAPPAPSKKAPAPPSDPFASSRFPSSPPPVALGPADAALAADAGDAEAERDLSAELSTALASVTNCADLPSAAQQRDGRLVIAVSAYVLGSGRISRLTVTAPGQPPEALRCMEQQALSLTLRDPIPNAPLNIKGSTELQVKSVSRSDAAVTAPIPVAPTQPVAPGNPNVAQPNADDMARPDTESLAGPPQ